MAIWLKHAMLSGAAAAALSLAPASAQTVGVNATVVSDVKMTTQANPRMHPAVVKERVSLGNDIVTGRGGRLQVLLLDKTVFTVGANARMKVDRFVYDPNRKSSTVGVSVTKGAFRFMSGKPVRANPGQSGIRTPVASIGIRGTIVEGAVGRDAIRIARNQPGLPAFKADPEQATLILLRGPGAGTQGDEHPGAIDVEAGGKTVSLTGSGYAVFIPGPGQEPIGPFLLGDWGQAYLSWLSGGGPFAIGTGPGEPGGWGDYTGEDDLLIFGDGLCAGGGAAGPLSDNISSGPLGGCGVTQPF
ncbi:FecR family protein [Sphingomonas canadensis]|uniref:FecR family protein n=1 Tax=Sphingomonas canadensis TaxID=1219257 RepID=A0ABW3HE36_9SPHN|nr:FecR family protein [Sphingomonas canadensis]MCW3837393.1 FecR family protein [Sphingomonas canadensis]